MYKSIRTYSNRNLRISFMGGNQGDTLNCNVLITMDSDEVHSQEDSHQLFHYQHWDWCLSFGFEHLWLFHQICCKIWLKIIHIYKTNHYLTDSILCSSLIRLRLRLRDLMGLVCFWKVRFKRVLFCRDQNLLKKEFTCSTISCVQ